jgi:Concanavalin A-like lectin/glucanases superfamily
MNNAVGIKRAGTWSYAVSLLGLCVVPLGCGSADDKFAAESYDEYTQPLTDAVIGTPSGTITIGSDASVGKAGGSSVAGGGPVLGAGGASGGSGPTTGGTGPTTGGAAGSFGVGGAAGSFGVGGEAGSDPGGGGGFGFWHFDDCSPASHFLIDSSGMGANAQQALKATCVPGISGEGVQFANAKDIVQVPDEPQFTVTEHVGVAAWVHPNQVSGDQPIVIKRLNDKTAFSLGIHNGNIEMSVVLSTGKTVISRAPIAANTWTHVAGLYDGTFVFLFINGQQFGQVFAAGSVRDVFAPIRIGATTGSQHFDGIIDEVFLSTQAISASTLTALSCISRPSTLTVNPAAGGPVPFDSSVHYDVVATNNDVGACQAKPYQMFFGGVDPGINASFDTGQFISVSPGSTATFGVDVTGSDDADPGVHTLPFIVDSFGSPPNFSFEQLNGQLSFELTAPTGCFVNTRRELMITSTSVVDDPIRTAGASNPNGGFGSAGAGSVGGSGPIGEAGETGFVAPLGGTVPSGKAGASAAGGSSSAGAPGSNGGASGGSGGSGPIGGPVTAGVWSFGHLMREMAPTPEAAPALTLQLLQHWLTNQTINGFTVQARPAMQQQLIDIWPKTADGSLDLDQSPLTLQAIVNRVDERNLAEGSAGEGRFVFGVNGGINFQNFTLIVEYNLPAQTDQDVLDWANRWHALSTHPFPSEEYNAALEAVTRRFTDRGAAPGKPNGSALVELRTNEIALSFQWELRAFVLSPSTGFFDETTVKETPDLAFNNSQGFGDFVNQNADAIIAEVPGANAHTVPLQFEGRPFMGGSVFNNLVSWNGSGIINPEARFHASMNTCNGCHGPETNTTFLMVTPRFPGSEAQLSPFLTGTTAFDPITGQARSLNDLSRRKADLTSLVCSAPATQATPGAATPAPTPTPTPPSKKTKK